MGTLEGALMDQFKLSTKLKIDVDDYRRLQSNHRDRCYEFRQRAMGRQLSMEGEGANRARLVKDMSKTSEAPAMVGAQAGTDAQDGQRQGTKNKRN